MKLTARAALSVVLALVVPAACAETPLGGSGPAPFQPIKEVIEVSSTGDAEGGWTFTIVVKLNNDVPLPTSPADCNPAAPGFGYDGLPLVAGREYDVIVSDFLAGDNPSNIQVVNFGFMPCGHPPVGVFTVPHYDIHFFYASQEERSKWTCLAAEQPFAAPLCFDSLEATEFFSYPEANANVIEGFYADNDVGVKGQGMHWWKQSVTTPWEESTVVQTTYNGEVVCFEVMVPLNLPAGAESGIAFQNPTFDYNPSAYTYSLLEMPDGNIVTVTVSKEM